MFSGNNFLEMSVIFVSLYTLFDKRTIHKTGSLSLEHFCHAFLLHCDKDLNKKHTFLVPPIIMDLIQPYTCK